MTANRRSDSDHVPETATRSIHDHWIFFVAEGVTLILLGLLAIVIPSIASANVTVVLGWLFLASGGIGLATTYWARQAPGFWWSLVSALLAIVVGVVLIANKSQDLYGGLIGWPFEKAGPLRLILVLFFLVEGGASIMALPRCERGVHRLRKPRVVVRTANSDLLSYHRPTIHFAPRTVSQTIANSTVTTTTASSSAIERSCGYCEEPTWHGGDDHPWTARSRLAAAARHRTTLAAEIKRRLRCSRLMT